jgi:hypothetical protein
MRLYLGKQQNLEGSGFEWIKDKGGKVGKVKQKQRAQGSGPESSDILSMYVHVV